MDIENICNLLLEALAEAGFNESTLFNYRGYTPTQSLLQ